MKTRYIQYPYMLNNVLVWTKSKAYYLLHDNTIYDIPAAQDCAFNAHLHSGAIEITYHQFIMWLCWYEPIVFPIKETVNE